MNRNKTLNVRMTQEEYDMLIVNATACGMSLSTWIRHINRTEFHKNNKPSTNA